MFYFYLAKTELLKKLPIGDFLSCQLATFNLKTQIWPASQNTANFVQSCHLATQKSPIGNFLSNFNFY